MEDLGLVVTQRGRHFFQHEAACGVEHHVCVCWRAELFFASTREHHGPFLRMSWRSRIFHFHSDGKFGLASACGFGVGHFSFLGNRSREHATVSNSSATGAARLAGAGQGSQTGLATTAPRVRHAGAQGLDEKAADEQEVDF